MSEVIKSPYYTQSRSKDPNFHRPFCPHCGEDLRAARAIRLELANENCLLDWEVTQLDKRKVYEITDPDALSYFDENLVIEILCAYCEKNIDGLEVLDADMDGLDEEERPYRLVRQYNRENKQVYYVRRFYHYIDMACYDLAVVDIHDDIVENTHRHKITEIIPNWFP